MTLLIDTMETIFASISFFLFLISSLDLGTTIDIERRKIDCLSFVMCPLLAQLILFFLFLLQLFTVLMKQTRQAVRAVKQSIIFLDVYGTNRIHP